jgi:hypothetical protein
VYDEQQCTYCSATSNEMQKITTAGFGTEEKQKEMKCLQATLESCQSVIQQTAVFSQSINE